MQTGKKIFFFILKIFFYIINFRAILECGTRAFVSFVEAYFKHDCQIVCRFCDLNVAGIAYSFGLLRLPLMKELKKCKQNLNECFKGREDIQTSTIKFKDNKAEELRQQKINKKMNERQDGIINQKKIELKNTENFKKHKNKRKRKMSDFEELQREALILKKFKRGKISKQDVENLI